MARVLNWRNRLNGVIADYRRKAFVWGQSDCCMWVGDCILAMTDVDLVSEFRGTYDSVQGAMDTLALNDWSSVLDLATSHYTEWKVGSDPAPAFARHGDIGAITAANTGWALGLFLTDRVMFMSPRGLNTMSRSQIVRAFKVD